MLLGFLFVVVFIALFIFFIPFTGFLLSICFFFIKRLRFLASFALFIPLTASYGALAGFWGTGMSLGALSIGLDIRNPSWTIAKLAAPWFGLLTGAVIGCAIGLGSGFLTNRIIRRWHLGL